MANNRTILLRNFREQPEAAVFEDAKSWKEIGLEWLQGYSHHSGLIPNLLEEADFFTLDHPLKNVIQSGGKIWFAEVISNGVSEIAGTIGLMEFNGVWEPIQLGVRPQFQGLGIGRMLVSTVIEFAKSKGIRRLYLDSNSSLRTAIQIYESFGFRHLPASRKRYATADVAMELELGTATD